MAQTGDRPLADLRVLVAEDEYFIADDLVRALAEAGAVPIGPVSSPAEVEALLMDGQVDAAILDMNLRGQIADGVALKAKEMKLPCLIVSGYSLNALPDAVNLIPRLEKPVDSSKVIHALIEQIETGHL